MTNPLQLKVRIKPTEKAVLYTTTPPAYANEYAAGIDLHACIGAPIHIQPGQRVLVPTGFIFEIPHGYEGQIRSRSGLALKKGVSVLNAPGTIDSDYRGEVMCILYNSDNDAYMLSPNDRIGQMVIAPVIRAELEQLKVTDELTDTKRGAGGFGSTGQ